MLKTYYAKKKNDENLYNIIEYKYVNQAFLFLRNFTLFVNYNIYRDLYSYRGAAVPIFTFLVFFLSTSL